MFSFKDRSRALRDKFLGFILSFKNRKIGFNKESIGKEKIIGVKSTLFMIPSVLGLLVFFVVPFLIVIYYSLVDNPINHEFVGLSNYFMLFKNLAFRKAFGNTAVFSLVSVPLAVIFSLTLAVCLVQKIPCGSQIRSFFLSPLMVPTASIVLVWQVLFHNNGTLNSILTWMGHGRVDWLNSSYAQVVVVLLFLWKNLGYNMVLFMAALASIPETMIEAASLEGLSGFKLFFTIKIRFITSTILFVTIMSMVNSFKVFREVYLLKGSYPYETMYILQHFMNNTFRTLDYQKMSSAAVIMAVVLIIIIGTLFYADNKLGKDFEEE